MRGEKNQFQMQVLKSQCRDGPYYPSVWHTSLLRWRDGHGQGELTHSLTHTHIHPTPPSGSELAWIIPSTRSSVRQDAQHAPSSPIA